MAELVHDGWTITAAMMSAVLVIGIALAFLESQWGAISGRSGMAAAAFDKIVFLAACALVVAAATLSANLLQGVLAAASGGSREGLVEAFSLVGMLVADILIVASSLLVTLGILGGTVAGQFFLAVGQARGMSDAAARVVGAVAFGAGAMLTIPIANLIVRAVVRAVV